MSEYENKIKEVDALQKEINSYRPLNEQQLKELRGYYKIGLTYSSNALEGNSLTETETKIVLEDGLTIGGKPLKDHYEATGHAAAFDIIFNLAKNKELSEADILKLHHLFYHQINVEQAGRYRQQQVIITGTDFIPPAAKLVPTLMKEYVAGLAILENEKHPVEYAALAHLDFVEIHPFVDGNGRVARLLMNIVLLAKGYVITIIPPAVRRDYIDAIKAAQTGQKSKQPFINFISNMVLESQKDYLRLLKALK
ncbi:cell filamentation protein Fic [Candidatus Saganbacteria bacterium CG08_land_8_20_14_0_20_45_16]|uniref:Cell filamentation protein Fic n=1 Tax=Candidatus Saganbacteria bacterium CG08_land_8_20_14_0_20_45_16 TaxID=2014293 RepID=A0A2H0XZT1_UNCSA|nr:MAG: cell filamentation protein Fic [Candidatus Saganbacteria bacterium CG08_land_8_20_14_0_20_45_16]